MLDCIKCSGLFFYIFLTVGFYSVAYHDSIRHSPRQSGDPVTLHWEKRTPPDKSYAGAKRYPVDGQGKVVDGDLFSLVGSASSMLNRLMSQLKNDVSADGLLSVGIYVLLRGERFPDGLYYYDSGEGEHKVNDKRFSVITIEGDERADSADRGDYQQIETGNRPGT